MDARGVLTESYAHGTGNDEAAAGNEEGERKPGSILKKAGERSSTRDLSGKRGSVRSMQSSVESFKSNRRQSMEQGEEKGSSSGGSGHDEEGGESGVESDDGEGAERTGAGEGRKKMLYVAPCMASFKNLDSALSAVEERHNKGLNKKSQSSLPQIKRAVRTTSLGLGFRV